MNSGHFSNTFPKVVNATKRLKFFWVLVFNWWIITTLANKCVVIKALQRNTSPILIISLLKMNKGVKVYIYVSVRWVQAHKRTLYTLGTLGTYIPTEVKRLSLYIQSAPSLRLAGFVSARKYASLDFSSNYFSSGFIPVPTQAGDIYLSISPSSSICIIFSFIKFSLFLNMLPWLVFTIINSLFLCHSTSYLLAIYRCTCFSSSFKPINQSSQRVIWYSFHCHLNQILLPHIVYVIYLLCTQRKSVSWLYWRLLLMLKMWSSS